MPQSIPLPARVLATILLLIATSVVARRGVKDYAKEASEWAGKYIDKTRRPDQNRPEEHLAAPTKERAGLAGWTHHAHAGFRSMKERVQQTTKEDATRRAKTAAEWGGKKAGAKALALMAGKKVVGHVANFLDSTPLADGSGREGVPGGGVHDHLKQTSYHIQDWDRFNGLQSAQDPHDYGQGQSYEAGSSSGSHDYGQGQSYEVNSGGDVTQGQSSENPE